VPVSDRALALMVGAALPVGAQFGRENFAGDPLVRDFCDWAKQQLQVQVEVFVSWSCPPDVSILTASGASILVRSERFDTLLVEYLHLKDAGQGGEPLLTESAMRSAVLRWMAEFLLGYRWPQAALDAAMRALALRIDPEPPNPFRDQTLASIDEVRRAAVQCFCLAHELGHLIPSSHDEISLDTTIDGLSLSHCIARDIKEAGSGDAADVMMRVARSRIDAAILLREIDADLIALELVAAYIANTLRVSAETALEVALAAFEAQCFVYATKQTCLLLKRHAGRPDARDDFVQDDWVAATQFSVRARCVLRRAGLLLSRWSAPDEQQTAATINRFVPVIDAMFAESMEFRATLAAVAHQESERLRDTIPAWNTNQDRAVFGSLIDAAQNNSDVRFDLFYMLLAMGFPGGTDPIRWMEHLFDAQQAGS
jgi:hypothetical protein